MQILNYDASRAPAYPFLSKPPTRPLPPPPAFHSIATWAAHVQPGSPGSPHSPRRRSSLSRRPSIRSRKRSISINHSPARTTFTPTSTTPSVKEFDFDLTNLGYTSVFVHIPKTPTTPSPYLRPKQKMVDPNSFPIPEPPRTVKRFRSLSLLRSRARAAPPSPTKSTVTTKSKSKSKPQQVQPPQICAVTIAKRKKAVYAYASKAKHTQAPPSLANELALMQFADGGSTNANIKRLMEAQARAAAGTRANGELSVGDVYRDEKGGIWWDREEELEYAHLLDGGLDADEETKWVQFGGEPSPTHDSALALASLARRDSSMSTQTRDSDMDPCNLVKPLDEDAAFAIPSLCSSTTTTTTGTTTEVPPSPAVRRSKPLLTLPTRPRAHLRNNPQFILDLAAFTLPTSPSPSAAPRTPFTPRTPLTPRTPHSPRHPYTHTRTKSGSPIRTAFVVGACSSTGGGAVRPRGKARRRPAPLKLVVPPSAYVVVPAQMEVDAKEDFLAASFAPAPVHVQGQGQGQSVPESRRALGLKKGSRLDLRGLFGRKQ